MNYDFPNLFTLKVFENDQNDGVRAQQQGEFAVELLTAPRKRFSKSNYAKLVEKMLRRLRHL